MVAGGVTTIAGIVITDTTKELSWLMRVNPSTQAAETGKDARVVSTTVAVAARAAVASGIEDSVDERDAARAAL